MKTAHLLLVLVSAAWTVHGFDDVIRDVIIGNLDQVQSDNVEKRAMLQSQGMNALADAFVSQIGTAGATKSATGSIIPWYPRPQPISLQTDYVKNCLGYIPAVGRRSVEKSEKKVANRDFIFVLDTSGSVLGSEFEAAKEAIVVLVESFCPSKLGHTVTSSGTKQIAMVLFGSRVTKVVDFEDSHGDIEHLRNKIMSVKHRREGATSTASALNYVKEAILGQGLSRLNDPDVSTDVIIITDGRCNSNCEDLAKEADAIRALGHGVNIFAVGVAAARECELDIISGKSPKSSFGLDGMNDFRQLAEMIYNKAKASANKCV